MHGVVLSSTSPAVILSNKAPERGTAFLAKDLSQPEASILSRQRGPTSWPALGKMPAFERRSAQQPNTPREEAAWDA